MPNLSSCRAIFCMFKTPAGYCGHSQSCSFKGTRPKKKDKKMNEYKQDGTNYKILEVIGNHMIVEVTWDSLEGASKQVWKFTSSEIQSLLESVKT